VKLSPKEREGLDGEELQRAQAALWQMVRTTNLIERAFREVKRRTAIVWNGFSLPSSMIRTIKVRRRSLSIFTQRACHRFSLYIV